MAVKRKRLFGDPPDPPTSSEEEDSSEVDDVEKCPPKKAKTTKVVEKDSVDIPVVFDVDQYVVAVYQGEWYMGQVLDKSSE